MKRRLLPAFVALALVGCGGGSSAQNPEAGPPDGSVSGETLPAGWSGFDVQATLTLKPVAGVGDWSSFPKTHTFTFVWDPVAGKAIAGAGGPISAGAVAADGATSTFRTTEPLSVGVTFADSCGALATVEYDEILFSFDGALHGTARGHASYQTGDEVWTAELTATLEGTPDATPPAAGLPSSAIGPLEPFVLSLSEPVPATATASLRGTNSGDVIALEPVLDVSEQAIGSFAKPAVALRYDEVYTVVTDGLVDFAGLHAPTADAPVLRTGAAPPLSPADGFESVTTETFGKAGVLHGAPLTPIAGQTSLILNTGFGGGFGFLPYHLGPNLSVTLAVPPDATVVRFTTQLVAVYDLPQQTFYGDIRVASPGSEVAHLTNVEAMGFVKVTLPVDGDVYLGPLSTIDLPLPPGVSDQVTFEIAGVTFGCGLPPPPTALIIDDLRVE